MSCWYTGEVCPECGQPEATDGRQIWCSNPDCIVMAWVAGTTKEDQ